MMDFFEVNRAAKNLDRYTRAEQLYILEKLAFDFYLRKGFTPSWIVEAKNAVAASDLKFNPYHDDLGRFTFGPGGEDNNERDNSESGSPSSLFDDVEHIHIVQEELPPDIILDEPPATAVKPPFEKWPVDPFQPPAPGYTWRGRGPIGSSRGSWHNEETEESLHPDLEHGPPEGPHWDYIAPDGTQWRLFPDGRMEPKMLAAVQIT